MSKKLRQDDSLTYKVIKEIAKELNIPEKKVKASVWHFFSWQRESFNSLKYSSYLWNYFGTFEVIDSRYDKWMKKKQENETKLTNNNIKNNNNG